MRFWQMIIHFDKGDKCHEKSDILHYKKK